MLTQALRSKIDSLWGKFWSGGLSNPLTAIEQISYLLFMKRLDEMDLKNKADAEWLKKEQKSGQVFQGTQGDVYEYLLSEIAAAGKNGQFRTPRHIIQMICALVDPKLGDSICDPACAMCGPRRL